MSKPLRLAGLIIAFAMALFSATVFYRTGDWVAVVFLLGSLAYVGVFYLISRGDSP